MHSNISFLSEISDFLPCQLPVVNIENDKFLSYKYLSTLPSVIKITQFTNSTDPDEAAHDEPLCLDLHCLPCSL